MIQINDKLQQIHFEKLRRWCRCRSVRQATDVVVGLFVDHSA